MKRAMIIVPVLLLLAAITFAETPQTPRGAAGLPAAGLPAAGPSPEAGAVNAPALEETTVSKREAFVYREEGRRDPFLSVITAAKQAEAVKKKGLTPLEDFDVSQIVLSGIIGTAKGYYGLVGLPDGKHYTIKEGAAIGIHGGKVVRITADSVTVSQYLRDYKGRLQKEDFIMKLREEEE